MPQIQINRLALDKHFVSKAVGQPISEFLIRQAPSLEASYVSNILTLDVRTAKGEILNLILKSMTPLTPSGISTESEKSPLTPEGAFRLHMESYVTEIQFYGQIAPLIQKLSPTAPLSIPKLYCADTKSSYILMEDLRPRGYKTSNPFVGLNFEEVSLAMKSLARLHALSYVLLKRSYSQLVAERPAEDNPVLLKTHAAKPRLGLDLRKFAEDIYIHVAKTLGTRRDPQLAQRMMKFKGSVHSKMLQPVERTLGESPDPAYFPVIVHGDLWVNNILFLSKDSRASPEDAVLIDFQQSRRGCVYEDLLYFFMTSTLPSFRNQYFKESLEIYFTEFSKTLLTIDEPLPPQFTLEVLKSTCEDNWDFAFCYGIFAIPFQLGVFTPPQSPATPSPTKGKSAAEDPFETGNKSSVQLAQEFVDTGIAKGIQLAFDNSEKAIDRVEMIVKEMIELGIL